MTNPPIFYDERGRPYIMARVGRKPPFGEPVSPAVPEYRAINCGMPSCRGRCGRRCRTAVSRDLLVSLGPGFGKDADGDFDLLPAARKRLDYLLWAASGNPGVDPADAERARAQRLASLDADIAAEQAKLDHLVDSLLAATGDAFRASIQQRADRIEAQITRLRTQRAALDAERPAGLSAAHAETVVELVSELQYGLDDADPEARPNWRRLIEALEVRGEVRLDPAGVRLGRKHGFRIEWVARIPLVHLDPDYKYKGKGLVSFGAAKKHLALYGLSANFADRYKIELTGFDASAGTVRFTPEKPLSAEFVEQVIRDRIEEIDTNTKTK